MNTETVTTHDIRVGDRIAHYGMLLRVDTEPEASPAHPTDGPGGVCKWTRAVVENFAELETNAAAGDSTAQYLLSFIRDDMSPNGHQARNGHTPDVEPRWTIQGNGLARWARIVD